MESNQRCGRAIYEMGVVSVSASDTLQYPSNCYIPLYLLEMSVNAVKCVGKLRAPSCQIPDLHLPNTIYLSGSIVFEM